jgi:hypothetical protein
MKKYIFTESQLKKLIDSEIDERSRSLAMTRKKRLFSKSEMMSNPDRYKEYDKELKGVNEEDTQGDNECISVEVEELNAIMPGLGELAASEYENEELLLTIADPQKKEYFTQITNGLSNMSIDQLKQELGKLLSIKKQKISEQDGDQPYLDRTVNIGGQEVPIVAVHAIAGIIALSILSAIVRMVGSVPGNRRRRLTQRSVGCQGARARAKLQRIKRRKESWRRFLRNIGFR